MFSNVFIRKLVFSFLFLNSVLCVTGAYAEAPIKGYTFSTALVGRKPIEFTKEALCTLANVRPIQPTVIEPVQYVNPQMGPYSIDGCRFKKSDTGNDVSALIAIQIDVCADHTFTLTNSGPVDKRCPLSSGSPANYEGIPIGDVIDGTCLLCDGLQSGTGLNRVSTVLDSDESIVYSSALPLTSRGGFGFGWTHRWQAQLQINVAQNVPYEVIAMRGDGRGERFTRSSSTWQSSLPTSQAGRLSEVAATSSIGKRWQYRQPNDETYEFDSGGRLLSVKYRNGTASTLTYSDASTPASVAPYGGLLTKIQYASGKVLELTYRADARISRILRQGSELARFEYNADLMLTDIQWPDGTHRQLHYEDTRFPWALTGITDEKGVRFATYGYDSSGRAISTEHAGGIDKFQFSFLGNGQTSVTTADATSRTFTSELQGNVLRATGASASCPACGDIAKAVTYDAAGNVASKRDFADKETRYSYDALGRETQRIDGYGTADAKTTTTEWHPTWNLPVRVTRPGQINNFSYGTAGQLLSYAWYASDDPNGSKGFQAVPTGGENSTVWVYNSQGLVEKATDTLNGVTMGEWTFSYDSTGQLISLANDYGGVGNVVSRDAGGRITEAVSTGGQHLLMQYDAMGRLTSRDVDGVVTTYTYNEIGLLTAVQGATNVMFEYDAAHRLTAYLLPEGQTMQASDISNPFLMASSMSSSSTKAVPQESLWIRVWSTIKRWLGVLIGDANAQAGWQRTPVSPVGPSQSRGIPSSSSDADILEQGTGSRQWPDPVTILATWTTQTIEKGIQAAKDAVCGSNEPCPPCKTVTGRIVAPGTIAFRPLDTPPPGKVQHGIEGPHYNIAKANQAPRSSSKPCWCFWQPIGAVRPQDLPANAIPIEHFAN